MRWLALLTCSLAAGCLPQEAEVPATPAAPAIPAHAVRVDAPVDSRGMVIVVPGRPVSPDAIAPQWRGEWETDTGYRCIFELTLAVDRSGVVDGLFRWTLKDAPETSTQHARIGQSGSEWVRGAYDPQSRQLTLVGYAVDAPQLLVADQYVLVLDPSGARLQGKSMGEGGLWRDRLRATAVAQPAADG